ncbi:MAG TPA: tyrosinase family protein [Nitrososphaeraceae archaeon]|jgi:tyrosinase|nr:tyrosinase family protein [Nitrososphaeraceae archaeon]
MEKPVEIVRHEMNLFPFPERRHYYGHNVPSESITFVKAGTVQRKNQATISSTDKSTFVDGIKAFNMAAASPQAGGNYRQLVSIHRHWWHLMHSADGELGTQRFLTWHRVYLSVLEFYIRLIPNFSNFFIPYWDWATDKSIPAWLENFTPHVDIPDTETIPPTPSSWDHIDVYRTPGQHGGYLPYPDQVNNALTIDQYRSFTMYLENLHNNVHAWVGGTMTDIMTSPADPLFWLHHANIDRIYTLWQKTHPDSPVHIPDLGPPGSLAQVMDPWSGTEPQWRHSTWAEYL